MRADATDTVAWSVRLSVRVCTGHDVSRATTAELIDDV